MDIRKAIVTIWIFLVGRALGEKYDFEVYNTVKFESTTPTNSKCTCTRMSNESGYQWNKWSTCQRHSSQYMCHRGIQFRSRTCSKSDSERSVCRERELKHCYDAGSCTGEWQEWSESLYGGECSHTCGGGIRMKVRVCTLNHEVGLFCKGKYRSPYEMKKEVCNTQKCPTWSDWNIVLMNCSSTTPGGIITTRRECIDSASNHSRCGISKNLTEEIIVRQCDHSKDASSSEKNPPTSKTVHIETSFSENKLAHVLLAFIVLFVLSLIAIGMFICCKKRSKGMRHLKSHQTGIYRGKASPAGTLSSLNTHSNTNSSRKTHQKYEEIAIRLGSTGNDYHSGRKGKGRWKLSLESYENTFRSVKNGENQWKNEQNSGENTPPSSEEAATTYTYMSGSSTIGSRGDASIKRKHGNPEMSRNMMINIPNDEPMNERYSSTPPPPLPSPYVDSGRKQLSNGKGSFGSSPRVKGERRHTRNRSAKRWKREDNGHHHKDASDDFDYAVTSFQDMDSCVDSNSRRPSRGSSQRNKHLYDEIREFKGIDAPGIVQYAVCKPKSVQPIVV